MGTRIGVAAISLLMLVCLFLVGQKAVIALGTGEPIAVVIGVALFLLVAIGLWAMLRELSFGSGSARLGRELEALGRLPEEEVPLRPSGRAERDAVDELFPQYRAEVEAEPESWIAWYRLGIVYDGAGDRTRARQAIRQAIRLHRRAGA